MSSYKIVQSKYPDDGYNSDGEMMDYDYLFRNLEEKVEIHMAQGWSCVGGLVLLTDGNLITAIYQTMIKVPN